MASEAQELWNRTVERFEEWLRQNGKSRFTIKNYLHDLKMFAAWHEEYFDGLPDPRRIQSLDYLAYRAHLQTEKRQSVSTVNRRIAALKCFSDFLHAKEIITKNVGQSVSYLATPPQTAPEVLTHAQVLQLFKAIDTTKPQGKRDYAIIQLFVQCGLRLKELAGIKLQDIDISERAGVLRVADGKGGSPREVPLNKTAREAIMEYRATRPRNLKVDYLFLSQKKNKLAPRSIQDIVKKYLKMIGMGDYSCHSLRHLFATNLYNQHKDIVLVKEALGHKQLGTTLRYSHKTKDEMRQAVEDSSLNVMR